jgi:protein involved in polysaccharide export with SLBB domain
MKRLTLSSLLLSMAFALAAAPATVAAQSYTGSNTPITITPGSTAPAPSSTTTGVLPLPIPGVGSPSSQMGTTPLPPASAMTPPAPLGTVTPSVSPTTGTGTTPLLRPQPLTTDPQLAVRNDVFGANLFTGLFAREGATQFNPNYAVATGDQVQLRLWGAYDLDTVLTVDPQGNIFIPHVGPVRVLGVRNQELQQMVEAAVARTFRTNVRSYASLAAAQPVRVFVGGNVMRPGLYSGTSMDSLLHYLDQAGGIDPDRGTFLAIQVKRGTTVRMTVNLYDFLLEGVMPLIQLADGDVVFVPPRQHTVRVSGLAQNQKRFEFSGDNRTVADLLGLAKPMPQATHVRVVRNTGLVSNTEYYPLADASRIALQNGDDLELTADKKPGTITVRVQGEHLSPQEYVLPYGTRLGELLRTVQYSERSDTNSVQLFRATVQQRQQAMLATSLKQLEAAALTARSATSDEARLRKDESDLLLAWVDRAKAIVPKGQVVISRTTVRDDLLLENGDVVNVPTRDGLVLISGEVLFPNAVPYEPGLSLDEIIQRAGGYTQNADASRVVVAHRDGTFEQVTDNRRWSDSSLRSGDEILVLPKIDVKTRQIWKDWSQIIFQLAVTAKVALGL